LDNADSLPVRLLPGNDSFILKIGNNLCRAFLNRLLISIQYEFRLFRLLIGCRYAGKFRNLTGAGFFIQPLGVPPLTLIQRAAAINL
jgi:hypothetical protein